MYKLSHFVVQQKLAQINYSSIFLMSKINKIKLKPACSLREKKTSDKLKRQFKDFLGGTADTTEKAMAPTPVLSPGKSHGAWWAAVHGVAKSQTQLSDFTFTFHFHALEKEMATHSSVLAWRIPGTGEPGGLPSMGSHRVGHD